ncbi:prepilin-type N-terminal cleavage/methylation domain-containing protein [Paenibacillus sp. IB182496]|uniref:Prepilin-type N-terminal cleavage/methylation domain-containing protein n=2 Tax=Paenibacillus sabuli TaxID=2772509 RepID=A0A927BZF6_9BACL|nr:prepilin-type N-terminal cleavage/methylation domain-containing protein [Paenibacillus sabuli]
MRTILKNEKGLTLVELLAVIVIVGIIAAIAVPAIGATIKNAEEKSDTATDKMIEEAALRYAIDEEVSTATAVTLSNAATGADLVREGYLNAIPTWNDTAKAKNGVTITPQANGTYTVTLTSG